MEKYTVIKKTNLFINCQLKDICNPWELTDFPGVVLAKDEEDNYIVFAATGCTIIKKYKSSDYIKPPISKNIFEKFDNYEDAVRMYDYLASIASKLPLFKPSKKLTYISDAKERVESTKIVIKNTVANFMDGVSLGYYVQVGKDESAYHIFLNDFVMYSFRNKEDFDEALSELATYIRNLPKLNITKSDLPDWFSLSRQTLWNIINMFHAFHDNYFCKRVELNKDIPEFYISLENGDSFFKAKIMSPARNSYYWGDDIYFSLDVSEDIAQFIEQKPYFVTKKTYDYEFKRMDRIELDTLITQLNEKFPNNVFDKRFDFTI